MLLIGDIGGTLARLTLVPIDGNLSLPRAEATFPSRQYAGLPELVATFRRQAPAHIERAVFAVAGPVIDGRAELSNLPWVLEEHQLCEVLGLLSVRLVNDLFAKAYAIPYLSQDAIHTLQQGTREAHGPLAIIAPGTGLGEAFLTWNGTRYCAHASEGGHADFAPTDILQIELLEWLRMRFGHVSYERVCSGRGLPNLYDFLKQRGTAPEPEQLAAQLAAAEDPTPVIVQAAITQHEPCALGVATVELFAMILAAEAGNAALRLLATGGVYLGGGLPRRLLPILARQAIIHRFRQKGRLSSLLERIPLHVIVRPNVALLGAIHYALSTGIDSAST